MDKVIHQNQVEKQPHRYRDHKHHPISHLSTFFNLPTSSPPNYPEIHFSQSQTYLELINQSSMATSTCAVSMAMPLTHHIKTALPNSTFFNPLAFSSMVKTADLKGSKRMMVVQSSLKEKAVTAAALTASMVVPEVAEAASGVTPSLNNFLLSIGAGGAVLVAILGAIIGVSNFDPVKRG